MDTISSLALCTVLVHLAGRFIFFQAFLDFLPQNRWKKMALSFIILALLNFIFYYVLFQGFTHTVILYKASLALGWIPYVLLSFYWLPRFIAQQIFVLGMQGLWSFFLHTASILTIISLGKNIPVEWRLSMQLTCFLFYFLLSLPLAARMFRHICPSRQLINDKPYGYYIAFLPLLIAFTQLPISLEPGLWTMDKLLSRILTFVPFIALYRYIKLQARDLETEVLLKSTNEVQQKAIRFFQSNMLLIQASTKQFSILRHDMRHQINILYGLISSGKSEEALHLLRSFDEHLEKTAIHPFCLNPFVNAVLSVYIVKAKDAGIPVTCRVNFPEEVPKVQENLSFALANLLENAIRVSETQDEDKRFLHINLQTKGRQVFLSVENYYAEPVPLNEDGYPVTHRPGHGIGMTSVHHFIMSYKGFKNFTQKDGVVRFEIYFTLPDTPLNTPSV